MYEKTSEVSMGGSASPLAGNVSSFYEESRGTVVGVICKNMFHIKALNSTYSQEARYRGGTGDYGVNLTEAKWCEIGKKHILILASREGVQLLEWDGAVLLFCHTLPSSVFARGITSLSHRYVCVGTSEGHILIIDVPPDGSDILLSDSVPVHCSAVSVVTGENDSCVGISGDSLGSLFYWQVEDGKITCKTELDNLSCAVTSAAVWKNLIVAGFGSGKIRLYSLSSESMIAEVNAHARWITCLDVCPGLAVSTAEDSFIRVWDLDQESDSPISHKFCTSQRHSIVLGARFSKPSGESLIVSAYDRADLLHYTS